VGERFIPAAIPGAAQTLEPTGRFAMMQYRSMRCPSRLPGWGDVGEGCQV